MKITSNQLLAASQSESIKTINSPLEFFTPLFLADPGPRFFWDTYNKLNLNLFSKLFTYSSVPSVDPSSEIIISKNLGSKVCFFIELNK